MSDHRLRVAFTLFAGRDWLGGYNYLLNMLRVLHSHPDQGVEPILYAGEDAGEEDLGPFRELGVPVVIEQHFDRQARSRRSLRALASGRDHQAEALFREQGIDAVFEHADFFGWRCSLPVIAWLGDFQHRHLPHMFSQRAYWRREMGMRLQIATGRTIMVSSESARRDCTEFFGLPEHRSKVVRFAVGVTPDWPLEDPEEVRKRYGLPVGFFHVPNQFWRHKNHRLLLEAMARLDRPELVVVTTGRSEDPRHPDHFAQLQEFVATHGLEDRFRCLGVVPYADMIGLMRASAAVINPSRFEGWSTTVEEARALGVPLLLSDIPVQREQMNGEARFFGVDSSEQLAAAVAEQFEHRWDPASGARPIPDSAARLSQFAADFASVAQTAVHQNLADS